MPREISSSASPAVASPTFSRTGDGADKGFAPLFSRTDDHFERRGQSNLETPGNLQVSVAGRAERGGQ